LKLVSCAALALWVAALTGCTTDQGMLSLAAPYEVSLDARRLDLETLPIVHDVEGSHWAVTSFLFVPLSPGPSLADAVADAVARGHGDILTRARVTTTKYWFLVGIEQITVRGNVVDLRAANP
jgi:hypothetical protein